MLKLLIIIRKTRPFWTIHTQDKGEDKQYHMVRPLFLQWFKRILKK